MELFFNLFKVRFNILTELLKNNSEDINISQSDTINVFINLETILLRLCNIKTLEYIGVNKKAKIEFISNVINLAAHYRMFFSKHKLESNIYLYMPSLCVNEYKNSIYNNEYRVYYKFKFSENAGNISIYKMIQETIPFLKLITEYIQGVYFIESGQIENSLVPYIINSENDSNNKNFIVTADIYDLQYVNYNTYIIIPKGDNSFICTSNNIMDYLIKIYECKGSYKISPKFLPFILSIIGSKSRNIYNIKGLGAKKTFKLIQKAIDEKTVSNHIDNIILLLNVVNHDIRDEILKNYYCVDLVNQYNQLTKKDIYDITCQLKDKYDNIALKHINDRYFIEYPLMLQEICYNPIQKKKIVF